MNEYNYWTKEQQWMIDKIIGNVNPIGKCYEDEKRLDNFKFLDHLFRNAFSKVVEVSYCKDDGQSSCSYVGKIADDLLYECYQVLKEEFENR